MKEFISKSAEETEKIGFDFAASLKTGDIISLSGSLGAGKTVFVKGVAKALAIKESIVSPTFTIVQEYDGRLKIYHLDLYRISGEDEFEAMGGEEFLYPDGVTFIEWSEKISTMLPEYTIYIQINIDQNGDRRITIN